MKQDFIEKLPPDAQKEFLRLAMKLDEKTKQETVNKDFLSFVKDVWPQFVKANTIKKLLTSLTRLQKVKLKN